MAIRLGRDLQKAVKRTAKAKGISVPEQVRRLVEDNLSPYEPMPRHDLKLELDRLATFLKRLPAVKMIAHDVWPNGRWWLKLRVDSEHAVAWRVIQELGFVLNYISVDEKLPTVFKPISPPPYLNGGVEFLSWVIESTSDHVDPAYIRSTLANRLPDVAHDASAWKVDQ